MLPARPISTARWTGHRNFARGRHRRDDDSGDQPDRRRLYRDLQIQPERRRRLPAVCADDHRRRLVANLPAASTAAAIIVTRVSDNGDKRRTSCWLIAVRRQRRLLAVGLHRTGIMARPGAIGAGNNRTSAVLLFSALPFGFQTGWRMRSKRPVGGGSGREKSRNAF